MTDHFDYRDDISHLSADRQSSRMEVETVLCDFNSGSFDPTIESILERDGWFHVGKWLLNDTTGRESEVVKSYNQVVLVRALAYANPAISKRDSAYVRMELRPYNDDSSLLQLYFQATHDNKPFVQANISLTKKSSFSALVTNLLKETEREFTKRISNGNRHAFKLR